MQISLASPNFALLMPKHLPQLPIFERPSLSSTLSVTDQVQHRHKTRSTVTVRYILDRMAAVLKRLNSTAHRKSHRAGYSSSDAVLESPGSTLVQRPAILNDRFHRSSEYFYYSADTLPQGSPQSFPCTSHQSATQGPNHLPGNRFTALYPQRQSGRSVKLNIHLHRVPRLRINGAPLHSLICLRGTHR